MVILESDFEALLGAQNTNQWTKSWKDLVAKTCEAPIPLNLNTFQLPLSLSVQDSINLSIHNSLNAPFDQMLNELLSEQACPFDLERNASVNSNDSFRTTSSGYSSSSFGSTDILNLAGSVKESAEYSHYVEPQDLIRVRQEDFASAPSSIRIPDDAFKKVKEGGKMMYLCTWKHCTSKFTRRAANCRAHWIRHNSTSPFTCEKCLLGFRRNADFIRHLHSCYSKNNY
jgi:hypothetical protein